MVRSFTASQKPGNGANVSSVTATVLAHSERMARILSRSAAFFAAIFAAWAAWALSELMGGALRRCR